MATAGPEPSTAPDAFVSYARIDGELVLPVVAAARARQRRLWMDDTDIPPGAAWRTELRTAIESATAVACFLSPAWLASAECRREYDRAVELGKRLVPVLVRPIEGAPDRLAALQWIDATTGADPGRVADSLLAAVDADYERTREHTYVLGRALRWESRPQDRSQLLRGKDLQAAEEWLDAGGVEPTPIRLQAELVRVSRQAERRRLRTAVGVALVVVALTAALAVTALVQRAVAVEQRNQAQSRALAAAALNQLSVDPERSLLLADAAYTTAPTSQAAAALRSSLQRSRVRTTLTAHSAPLSGVVWSPDGRTVVTAARDGTIAAWDAATGQARGRLARGPGAVDRLVVARLAPIGVAVTEDGVAVLWILDPGTGELVERAELAAEVTDVAISDDAQVIVTAGPSGVRRWAGSGAPGTPVPWVTTSAQAVTVSADGTTLLVSTGTATLVGPITGSRPVRLADAASSTLQLSTDGGVALAAADVGAAATYRVADGLSSALPSAYQAALDPTGQRAVVSRIDGQVELLTAGAPPVSLLGRGILTSAVGFSADAGMVVAGLLDGTVQIWQTRDGAPVAELKGGPAGTVRAAFAPDGRRLVTGHRDGSVRLWALPEQPVVLPLREGLAPGAFEATSARFTPDGARVLTAGRDGVARIWDATTGREEPTGEGCARPPLGPGCLGAATLSGHLSQLSRAVFSPDGRLIATAGFGGRVLVWDSSTVRVVARGPDVEGRVDDVAFSPDGRRLATADQRGTVRLLDAATGRVETELAAAPGVSVVAFTPGGEALLAAGGDRTVRRWRLGPGPPAPEVLGEIDADVLELAADPDGRQVAVGTTTGVEVLDLLDGRRVRTLIGHRGFVSGGLAYSPDGALLFSGGIDGTVRVWDTGTGDEVAQFTVPGGDVTDIGLDPVGRRVAAVTAGGEGFVFGCEVCLGPDELAGLAKQRATRALTAEERATFDVP